MKKLMIVACGFMFAQVAVFAQAAQDPQLQANASDAAVQQELSEPDGVAIKAAPDGSYQIFSRGTGVYDFNDSDDIMDARKEAQLRAKANISKFMKESVASSEGIDNVSKKIKNMKTDGQNQQVAASKETVKVITESIRNNSDAILTGVITLKEQKVAKGNGGEIQVTVGISSKTLTAAKALAQGINQSLSDRDSGQGGLMAPVAAPPAPNKGYTRKADTDF